MEIKCLNCGGVDLRFQKLGIPLRPQSGRPPQSELAVTAVECESCGFIGIFAGDQPETSATQNWPTTKSSQSHRSWRCGRIMAAVFEVKKEIPAYAVAWRVL
jgi:hypothetical protein